MSTHVQTVAEAFADAALQLGEGDTQVLETHVQPYVDDAYLTSWRITLFLPRPDADTWDVSKTRELKRRAASIFDDLAASRKVSGDRPTFVSLSSKQARADDIADIDVPQHDEAPESEG